MAVAHLLASATLERSPRARELLEYLAECRFTGRVEDVKEQIIGERLFGRPPGYNSAEDNIVRVAARQLRTKLHEYYESEGRAEVCVLEIPKGGYLPKFCARDVLLAAPEPVVATPRKGMYFWRIVPWVLCLGLAIALGWTLNQKRDVRPQPAPLAAQQPPLNTLVRLLAPKPGQHLNIVEVDSSLQLYRTLTGRTISLAEYIGGQYWSSPDVPPVLTRDSPVGRYIAGEMLTQHYLVPAIARVFESVPIDQFSFHHPSEMHAQDFQTDNALLIGGPFANPWAQLFEDKLNFQIETLPGHTHSQIRNLAPAPGEPPIYTDAADGTTNYSRISFRPNLRGTGVVMLVGGPSIAATDAAGRLIGDPNELNRVLGLMKVRNLRELPPFDILLKVVTRTGRASETSIAAWRRIDH